MNFRHAIGFLCMGFLLAQLPHLAPGWLSAGAHGAGTRLLWVQIMSWVQLGVGGTYLLGRMVGTIGSLLAFTPPLPSDEIGVETALPVPLRAARPTRARPVPAPEHVVPMPELEAGLLDQQRAA